jgi:hypothetical protein
MASSYTTSLKIQQIGAGEQSGIWGSTTNTNNTLLEQAITGVAPITMANSNYTLSSLNGVSDEARCMVIVASGTNSAVWQIVAPLVKKFYIVNNTTTGGYAVTIGGATGSIVSIPNGTVGQVYCDGTNFFSAQTGSAGNFNVNGTLTASAITDTGVLTVAGVTTLNGAATFASTTTHTGTATFNGASNHVGTTTVPTVATGDNSTNAASTALVTNKINAITSVPSAIQIGTTNYTVLESGGYLYFRYGGVNKMRLDSSGNLVCTGNITAYGSI